MSILKTPAVKAETWRQSQALIKTEADIRDLVNRLHASRMKSCSRFKRFAQHTPKNNPFALTAKAE